ncbi:unnamed protein product [Larinioides sclopetarius]|uniref:Uncharacterized protein n=1 Tax=Larinioides sclopetarius TaxID=280406 RepID=A0AAV2BUW1_9ARAC
MPKKKDPWTYKKRKKTKKTKNKVAPTKAKTIEHSRLPDPDGVTTPIELPSNISPYNPVKKEANYPDTRFETSTTLFPAEALKENRLPSATPCEISKPSAERSRLPDPDGVSTSKGISSDTLLNFPVKMEVDHPDTRFETSTTLFPAETLKENRQPSETPCEISKPSAECARLPNPDGVSTSEGLSSDTLLNFPVKKELDHPDTRFETSTTTLFPAEAVKENHLPSETPREISKRCAEEEFISASSKKLKISSDSTPLVEQAISEDVSILEAPPKKVKIEVIDLTDESTPINPIICSPVKTSFLQNKISGRPNMSPQSNGDIRVKVEASENTCEVIANAVGAADINCDAIQTNIEQGKASENISELNADKSNVDINKSINIPLDNPFPIQVKSEKNMPIESNNNVNIDESPVVPPFDIRIQIKTEQSESNETHNKVNFENPLVAVSRHTDTATQNILLRSELNKENEDNRQVTDQVPISNAVSDYITKNAPDTVNSINHLAVNDVPIKVELEENCIESGNSTSVSNLFYDVNRTDMSSVDLPEKNNQNRTYENCESNDSYMPASSTPSVCSTEIPPDILHGTKHLSNELQTEKNINDRLSHYSINSEEARRDMVSDENKTGVDSTVNCSLPALQMMSEPEKMDFLENSCNSVKFQNYEDLSQNSCNSEKFQNYEDLSQKSTNSINKSICVVPTETFITDQLNRISISPINDGGIFDVGDSQLYKPGTFRTPLLKYLNCNTKADALQVSHLRSFLSGIINKNEISDTGSEVISDFTDSRNEFELPVAEKREELSNLQVSEKQSLNFEVEKILDKMSSWPNLKEFLNSNTNTDSNSASSQLKEFIIDGHAHNSSNDDGLDDEKRQNSSPNRFFESPSTISEYNQLSKSDSHTVDFVSPMDIECPSSLDENKQSETLKNQSMKAKELASGELFSNDFLRQILGSVKSAHSVDISKVSTTPSPSPDPVNKSKIIIDESVFQNLRQIDLFKNKLVEDVNSVPNVNEKNSDRIMKNSEISPKDFAVQSENVLKRTRDVLFNPSVTCADTVEVPPKRGKISEDASISKNNGLRKLSLDEYKKRDSRLIDSPHYQPDLYFTKQFAAESPSNSSDSSSGFSNFQQNIFTSANRQNLSLFTSSDTSLQNPNYRHMVNTSSLQDPRLARNNSRSLYKEVNSQKQLCSFNIDQTYPFQSAPEASKSSVHPSLKQKPSTSTFDTMRNSSEMLPVSELFRPTVNTVKKPHTFSEPNNIHPSDFNQRTSDKDRRIFISSPPSESRSFSISPDISDQSIQGVRSRPPLLPFPHLSDNVSPPTHHHYSSGSASRENMPKPPLPTSIPPKPPLLPTPAIVEQSFSIAPKRSPNSLPLNYKKLAASKNLPFSNQSSSEFCFVSLLSKQLIEGIGRKVINTDEVYLIIIERNIDWILGIDKESGIPRISEIGGEFKLVRDSYVNHLAHYNTYFPLLLLDCFSKISTALKAAREKEKTIRNVCKVVLCETMESYVSFTCDSFIDRSDMDNIPKDGHIVLVKFSTKPTGNVKMLGYVCSSGLRNYSHNHDYGHEILRFVNTNNRSDLMKIKITFSIVFAIPGINLDAPIQVIKLTSIKKALMLNNALMKLKGSPLCDILLSPRNHNIKSVALPRRQDTNAMTTVVQEIVQTFPSSPQLIILKSAPFTDSFLAIVQIVEEMLKFNIPGKILVCVRAEVLNQMGMNLIETSSNVVIINREKENLHKRLESRTLDEMVKHYKSALDITEEKAKIRVFEEAEVLLVVTGTCFYEDVQCLAKDLTYCIIHDAQSFTEPESLLPLLYGIRHLLLFGDPDESCHVSSKCAARLGYNKSLFHRAYNLC